MMKGSANTQATMPQNAGPQNMGGQQFNPMMSILGMMIPGFGKRFGAGTGSKGAVQPQERQMSIPAMPQYTNYQQMPVYSSQPAAPSDAITRFMSGYASGGNVNSGGIDSIEDDIKAALRLARLIGELTKKE